MRVKNTPLTRVDLDAAKAVLGSDAPKAATDRLEARRAAGPRGPKPLSPRQEAALAKLEGVAAEHGEIHDLDVRVLAKTLSTKAARSVEDLYAALQDLKREGRLEEPGAATELTPALVARLAEGGLPARVATHLRRMAGLELTQLTAHPTKHAALRDAIGTELIRRYGVALKDLPRDQPPADVTLRERNARQSLALRALLSDPKLGMECRLACIEQLGRVGGPQDLPALEGLEGPAGAAAGAAIASITKAGKMKIVLAAFEARPYAGSGGLGNVMKELPKALAAMGHEVIVMMPRHTSIDRDKLQDTGLRGFIEHPAHGAEPFQILKDRSDGVDYYFIENDKYFSAGRNGLYGDYYGDFGDNARRYDFFGAAIPQAIQKVVGDDAPDIIQLNDAHTGSAAAYLRGFPGLERTKTVMAVHNLGGAYQGRYGGQELENFCFRDMDLFQPGGPAEFYGDVNLLKLGMVQADAVVTVSRQYMKEILTEKHGEGLHGVLRWLDAKDRLYGNLNGIDNSVWDPATDAMLPAPFSFEDQKGKAACKTALQERFGLPARPETPVLGVVARLAHQKGWDEVIQNIERNLAAGKDVQYVMCGTGDDVLAAELTALAKKYPDNVAFDQKFSPDKEHQIYGGADFFLMPSRFEPCGLPQMYALRYLTVPIVRRVGGLEESIQAYDPKSGRGTGFKFGGEGIHAAVDQALDWYGAGAEARQKLLRSCALADFSWEKSSAVEQAALYREVLGG